MSGESGTAGAIPCGTCNMYRGHRCGSSVFRMIFGLPLAKRGPLFWPMLLLSLLIKGVSLRLPLLSFPCGPPPLAVLPGRHCCSLPHWTSSNEPDCTVRLKASG